MSVIFSTIAFFALIATAVAGIAGVIGKACNRKTRANIVALVCLGISIVCFVGFGITHEPMEKPAQATQLPPVESAKLQQAETPATESAEPLEELSQTETETTPLAEPTHTPTPEPTPTSPVVPETPAPAPEPEEAIDPVEQDKAEIAETVGDIVVKNYTLTDVEQITVNENCGTEEDGDYVLLVYLTWNVKNSVNTTKNVLAMYSEDFAARIGTDAPKVNNITIFWTVPYYSGTDTAAKYSYERNSRGMYETDHMIMLK